MKRTKIDEPNGTRGLESREECLFQMGEGFREGGGGREPPPQNCFPMGMARYGRIMDVFLLSKHFKNGTAHEDIRHYVGTLVLTERGSFESLDLLPPAAGLRLNFYLLVFC